MEERIANHVAQMLKIPEESFIFTSIFVRTEEFRETSPFQIETSTPFNRTMASRGGSSNCEQGPHNLHRIFELPSRDSMIISFLMLLADSITSEHYKLRYNIHENV